MRPDTLIQKAERLLEQIQLEHERLANRPRIALYDPTESDIASGQYKYLAGHEPQPNAAYVIQLPDNGR